MHKSDPMNLAINMIRNSIDLTFSNGYYGATLILIFAGIDAMANIDRPNDKAFNDSRDFKEWIQKFLLLKGNTSISGDEWWATRNAITHTFGTAAKAHTKDDVRMLLWITDGKSDVFSSPETPDHVLVSIKALKDAFINGMDRFLPIAISDPNRKDIIEKRLNELVQPIPVDS